jgi:hypothetical protein
MRLVVELYSTAAAAIIATNILSFFTVAVAAAAASSILRRAHSRFMRKFEELKTGCGGGKGGSGCRSSCTAITMMPGGRLGNLI